MNLKIIVSSCLLLTVLNVFSQEDHLLYSTIPEELLKNANAVLRIDATSIEIASIKSLKQSYKRVITVLNKKGDNDVSAYLYYDDKTSIKRLEALVYDSSGKLVKKFRKSDFKDQSAVSDFSLYEDSRVKFINYTPIAYPYTVEFRFETLISNTAHIPFWRPLEGYFISTENSTYSVLYDQSIGIHTKENNFKNYDITNQSIEGLLKYEANNLKGLKPEDLSLAFRDFGPKLLISPMNFHYEGYFGSTKDWKSLGKWMYDELLVGRDQIPEATKGRIKALVRNINDPIEKAKIVYKYVQDNTRYISVQEGIGGIQPISALEVDKVKYGDCKGLTNYTKSLLDVVGVASNYTRLYASPNNQVNVDKDFVSFLGQTNHVILNIPNEGEDLWLECTSQKLPFGFIGDFTDDRDVFVITPEGGQIKHTKKYNVEENIQNIKGFYSISNSGSIEASFRVNSMGIQYDNKYFLETETERDLDKYYKERRWDYINNLSFSEMTISNNKEDIEFVENIRFDATNYTSIAGDRMLFKINALNRHTYVPDRYRNRTLPLKINRGFKDVDEVEVKVPEGYEIESIPEDKFIENKFGTYQTSITKKDENTLIYNRIFTVKDGEYPKEDYKAFRDFYKKVSRNDNAKLSLIKK